MTEADKKEISQFTNGKSEQSLILLEHFIKHFESVGNISMHAAKTMIGISSGKKRIAWITRIGKNFIHVVFPFKREYADNLCFQKIAQVPGDAKQFNHHFRMLLPEDVNEELLRFMRVAYEEK